MRLSVGYSRDMHRVWYQPPRQCDTDLDKVVRDDSGTCPGRPLSLSDEFKSHE